MVVVFSAQCQPSYQIPHLQQQQHCANGSAADAASALQCTPLRVPNPLIYCSIYRWQILINKGAYMHSNAIVAIATALLSPSQPFSFRPVPRLLLMLLLLLLLLTWAECCGSLSDCHSSSLLTAQLLANADSPSPSPSLPTATITMATTQLSHYTAAHPHSWSQRQLHQKHQQQQQQHRPLVQKQKQQRKQQQQQKYLHCKLIRTVVESTFWSTEKLRLLCFFQSC